MIVYAVVDDALSPDFPLGDALEAFIRREERLMRAAHGGRLTPFDRAILNARLNATSNAIWNKKH